MVAKIFEPVEEFEAVRYNSNKWEKGKGELLKVANFGPLMSYGEKRPADYRAYFEAVSALNKTIKKPVFHGMLSPGEHEVYSNEQLLEFGEKWLKEMGYGDQPYLAVLHRDTNHTHLHLVSTRITKEGKKISSAFEKVRSMRAMNKLLGIDPTLLSNKEVAKAWTYHFSTCAQFAMILERSGYKTNEKNGAVQVIKFGEVQSKVPLKDLDKKINAFQPDKKRAAELTAIFSDYLHYHKPDTLPAILKTTFGLDLIFHASAGKPPYGYTVIDHANGRVFKGGEIMPLKELLDYKPAENPEISKSETKDDWETQSEKAPTDDVFFAPVSIAQDVDDQAVHGRKRRKKRSPSR